MVPPRTNRTNRDPYGWRCTEGTTALPRNCHVSATARKNLAQSGTQPGGEMYRRRVASDRSRIAQLKVSTSWSINKSLPGILRLWAISASLQKAALANQMPWKMDVRLFPWKGQHRLARPRRKCTISKVAIRCVNHGRRSKQLHWRRWFTSLQPARPWRRMPRFPSA